MEPKIVVDTVVGFFYENVFLRGVVTSVSEDTIGVKYRVKELLSTDSVEVEAMIRPKDIWMYQTPGSLTEMPRIVFGPLSL